MTSTSTRIILQHGSTQYRLLHCKAASDGSLVIVIDRNPTPKKGGLTIRNGRVETDPVGDAETTHKGQFTCHTTGQINYHKGGTPRPHVTYGEPLYQLTRPNPFGYYSVPCVSKLDQFEPGGGDGPVAAIIIPPEFDERLSFGMTLLPLDASTQEQFGVALRYEVYALAIGVIDIPVPFEMARHFVTGCLREGVFDRRQIDIASAEIGFHMRGPKSQMLIFREKSGAYVVLADGPMRAAPSLLVEFDRSDLSAEQFEVPGNGPKTHKVKFWIRDASGRNKKDDLRSHIVQVSLDAEL